MRVASRVARPRGAPVGLGSRIRAAGRLVARSCAFPWGGAVAGFRGLGGRRWDGFRPCSVTAVGRTVPWRLRRQQRHRGRDRRRDHRGGHRRPDPAWQRLLGPRSRAGQLSVTRGSIGVPVGLGVDRGGDCRRRVRVTRYAVDGGDAAGVVEKHVVSGGRGRGCVSCIGGFGHRSTPKEGHAARLAPRQGRGPARRLRRAARRRRAPAA
jgi:hypothetical protein